MSDKADKECQCVCASKLDVVEGYPDHGFCITNINCRNKVFKARYYGAFGDGANTTGCYDGILWTVEADFNWCESGKFVGLPTTYDKVTATVRWKGTTPGTVLTQPKNYDGVITGIPFEFDPGLGFGQETVNKGKFTVAVRNTGSASTDIYCNADAQSQQRICYTLETELCFDGAELTECSGCNKLYTANDAVPEPKNACRKTVCINERAKDIIPAQFKPGVDGGDPNATNIHKKWSRSLPGGMFFPEP